MGGLLTQLIGLSRKENPANRVLAPLCLGLLDLQLVLGILLAVLGREEAVFPLSHVLAMGTAVLIAHILRVRAKRAAPPDHYRLETLVYAMPLVMVVVGLRML